MATWVRSGTGTAPTSTDANLSGRYSLDNGTAPGDFDPAGVTSVQIQYTITGSGTWVDDTWDDLRAATLDDGTNIAATINGTDNTGLTTGGSSTNETDSSPNTGLTQGQWESMAVSGGTGVNGNYTTHNQDMKGDGGVQTMSALTVTITYTPAAVVAYTQSNFRIRTASTSNLAANDNTDWDDALNTNVSQQIDYWTGIRFEVDVDGAVTEGFQLRYQVNGTGGYVLCPSNADPWTANADTDQDEVMCVPGSWTDGAATTNILSGSGATFRAGNHNDDATTATVAFGAAEHTELEWRIIIKKLSQDGHLADGDYVEFRVYRDDGTALDTYTNTPRITIANRPGHTGGAWIETSNRIWCRTDEDVLYTIRELSHWPASATRMIMMKSTDGGTTWAPVDDSNAPTVTDIEASDMHYVASEDTIHIAAMVTSGDDAYYATFRTSGHSTNPDTWDIKETVDSNAGTTTSQSVAIWRRTGDSTTVMFWADHDGTNDRIYYAIRNGTWGTVNNLDTEASTDMFHPRVVGDPGDDTLHIFYLATNGSVAELWHNTMNPSTDALGTRAQVDQSVTMGPSSASDRGPSSEPKIWNDGATERLSITYTDTSRNLYYNETATSSISWTNETGLNVVQNSGTVDVNTIVQHRSVHGLAIDDTDDVIYAAWADNADWDLMRNDRTSGTWGTSDTEWIAGRIQTVDLILYTHSGANGGARVLGIMLEDNWVGLEGGQGGGTGFSRYAELELVAGPTMFPPFRRTQLTTVRM